jgi:hypothetical protein
MSPPRESDQLAALPDANIAKQAGCPVPGEKAECLNWSSPQQPPSIDEAAFLLVQSGCRRIETGMQYRSSLPTDGYVANPTLLGFYI